MKEKKSKKKIIIPIVILGIIVLAVVIGGRFLTGTPGNMPANMSAATVETGEVSTRTIIQSVGATGTIVSAHKKEIKVELSNATVSEINVSVGDTVTEGQQLMVFDTSDIEQDLSDAQKSLSKTQQQYALTNEDNAATRETRIADAQKKIDDCEERIAELREAIGNQALYGLTDAKVYSLENELEEKQEQLATYKKDLEDTIASLDRSEKSTALNQDTTSQQRQIQEYKEQIANGTLYSPMDGIVTAINYEVGDKISGNGAVAVMTVQDVSAYDIETSIDEYSISDIEVGQSVLIKTNATGDLEMNGVVTMVSPVSTSGSSSGSSGMGSSSSGSTASYKVMISITDPSDRLRLDMSASLSIIIAKHENALTVPYNAVGTAEDGSRFVCVVGADGNTVEIPVTVILESNYYTEIASDQLMEGDIVQLIASDDGSNNDMFSQMMMDNQPGGF